MPLHSRAGQLRKRKLTVVERLDVDWRVVVPPHHPSHFLDGVLAVVTFEWHRRVVLRLDRTEDALPARQFLTGVDVRKVRRIKREPPAGPQHAVESLEQG